MVTGQFSPSGDPTLDRTVRLRYYLVGADHRALYNTSATFRLMVDQLSTWLPGWVDSLATQAQDTDRQLAEATDLAMRSTMPADLVARLAARGLPATYSNGKPLDPGDAGAVLRFADELYQVTATVIRDGVMRYPGDEGQPYVDPDEVPRLGAVHRALRSAGTQGTTAQLLARSGLPIDVVARFLRYLEAQGWARSSPNDPDNPDGPRTWWPDNNWTRHRYVDDWQVRGDAPCRHTVLGIRCRQAASAPVHAIGGPLSTPTPDGWDEPPHRYEVDTDGAACCHHGPEHPSHLVDDPPSAMGPHAYSPMIGGDGTEPCLSIWKGAGLTIRCGTARAHPIHDPHSTA